MVTALLSGRRSGTDEPYPIAAISVNDNQKSIAMRIANQDESILIFGMERIRNRQRQAIFESGAGFVKRHAQNQAVQNRNQSNLVSSSTGCSGDRAGSRSACRGSRRRPIHESGPGQRMAQTRTGCVSHLGPGGEGWARGWRGWKTSSLYPRHPSYP